MPYHRRHLPGPVPPKPRHAKRARLWVEEMRAVVPAGERGLLVRRERGGKRAAYPKGGRRGRPDPAQPGEAPRLLLSSLESRTMSRGWRNAPSSAPGRRMPPGPTNHWMAPAAMYEKLYGLCKRRDEGPHHVHRALPDGAARVDADQGRRGAYRLALCRAEHAGHDPHGPDCVGPTRRRRRLYTKGLHSMLDVNPERRFIVALSAGQHDHFGRLQLRRQRAAREEMPGVAAGLVPGPHRGLDGGAHAHPWR